jgi:cytochrome c-type biogenesis protein CcmH/NrfG
MSGEQDGTGQTPAMWSLGRISVLATVSLLIGLAAGFVMRGSSPLAVKAAAVSVPQAQSVARPDMPDETQLKHMAQKQAEPLMAKLQQTPDDATLLAQVARTYLRAGQYDIAAQYYERSVKSKPDADVLTSLGGVYLYSGAKDKALDAWQQAVKMDPRHADALVNIGLVKWRSDGDADAAIAAWQQMLKRNPNHPKRAQVEKMIAEVRKHAGISLPQAN